MLKWETHGWTDMKSDMDLVVAYIEETMKPFVENYNSEGMFCFLLDFNHSALFPRRNLLLQTVQMGMSKHTCSTLQAASQAPHLVVKRGFKI